MGCLKFCRRRVCYTLLFCCISVQIALSQSTAEADSLYEAARQAHLDSRLVESQGLYEQALEIYALGDDLYKRTNTQRYLVSVYWRLGKHDKALEFAESGIEMARMLNDQSLVTSFITNLATIKSRQGYYEQATDHFNEALELAYQIRDTTLIGTILHNFANLNRNMGNLAESIRLHQLDLELMEGSGDLTAKAITLNSLGVAYIGVGRLHQALESFERSLYLREKANFTGDYTLVYINIAYVHQEMGNYLLALDNYHKSLQTFQETGNTHNLARTLRAIGTLHYVQNDYDRAEYYFLQSHEIYAEAGDPSSLGESLKSLGNNYFKKGDYERALEFKQQRLALFQELGNSRDMGDAYSDLGTYYLKVKDYEKALWHFQQAYEVSQPLEHRMQYLNFLVNIGSVYAKLGKHELAYDNLVQAYHIGIAVNPDLPNLRVVKELAELHHAMKSEYAYYFAELLFDTIEKQRIQVGAAGRAKAGFFSSYAPFYARVASWYIDDKNSLEDAYRWVEAAKARAFIDDLAEASHNIDANLDPEYQKLKTEKSRRVTDLTSRLELAGESEHNEVMQELRAAELEYDAFLSRLRSTNPVYSRFDYPTPVDLDQVMGDLSPNTLVLEYSFSDSSLVGFAISSREAHGWTIPNADDGNHDTPNLDELASVFREAIINKLPEHEIRGAGRMLAELLLGPARDMLKQADQLIIIADGRLAYLPFEALPWNGQYLIHDYQIKYSPSMTALTLIQDPAEDYAMDLLQLANPDYGSLEQSHHGFAFASLPSSMLEANAIEPLFTKVTTLTGKDATEEAVKTMDLTKYRYLHFATHGLLNENNPDLSGLVLAQSNIHHDGHQEDGFLRSSEIYALNLNADLVVLSACETGMGKEVRGEGVLGLQRAFFHAGASTVVVSFWPVQDRSTALLMAAFYKELQEHDKRRNSWTSTIQRYLGWEDDDSYGYKAAAMRAAKLSLINGSDYSHPIYWAPFIVVGK